MTDNWLEQIEARANAATPGPWDYDGMHNEIHAYVAKEAWLIICDEYVVGDGPTLDEFGHHENANFRFIAHARADIPRLIAEVRALRTQVAIGRLAQEYVVAVNAEYEVETLGLDQEAFEAEWDRRWDVADAAYARLQEKVDAALAALEGE